MQKCKVFHNKLNINALSKKQYWISFAFTPFCPQKGSIFGIFAPHFSVSDAPLHKKHPSLLHEVRGEDYKNECVY